MMNKVCHFIFLIITIVLASELCLNSENGNSKSVNKTCKWIDPEKPSIIVKGTEGRLGNMMFTYLNLLFLKVSMTMIFQRKIWVFPILTRFRTPMKR